MEITRAQLEAYNAALKQLQREASITVENVLGGFFAQFPDATPQQVRSFSIALLQNIGEMHGNAAAQLAVLFREEIADASGAEIAKFVSQYSPPMDTISKTAHYQARLIDQDNIAGFVRNIATTSDFIVSRAANDTMMLALAADSKNDLKVKFARVPMGPETCPFCIMLSGRGYVYWSEETAGSNNHFHRNCDCRIVPGYDVDGAESASIEGYDPAEYHKQFVKMMKAGEISYEDVSRYAQRGMRWDPKAKYEVSKAIKYIEGGQTRASVQDRFARLAQYYEGDDLKKIEDVAAKRYDDFANKA